MQCPKCHSEQDDRNAICTRCGIVFEKYFRYHPPVGDPLGPLPGIIRMERLSSDAGGWVLPREVTGDWLVWWARGLLWLLLLVWGFGLAGSSVASGAVGESVLHLVNLPFHEAGHVLFRPLGAFMTSLGGTLGQLLMPAICLGVLLVKTRDPFGAAVCLWWLGENFLDIAPYIADARAGVLPLLGGNTGQTSPYGFHDWDYLLTETGLLHLDRDIAQASHALGSVLILLALVWGAILLHRQFHRLRREAA